MTIQKEILGMLASFSKEFLTTLEADVEDRVQKIMKEKIIKPLDFFRQRLMYSMTAAVTVTLGIICIALSMLIFAWKMLYDYFEIIFAGVGVLLLLVGVLFSYKLTNVGESS